MSDLVLQISGLSTGYEASAVVRDLDLEVRRGEVVALLGPNGAGKTTTLLAISGMAEILKGEIEVLGKSAPKLSKAHRLAGEGVLHVPEDRGLFRQLSVRENLELGPAGRPGIGRTTEIFPELEPMLDRRAGLLSGGEQQMVALGRAISAQPKLLMIDELSFGLAPALVQRLLPVVRKAADNGAAVLLVEQQVDLALEYADRGYVISHGDLVMTGNADELAKDESLFKATYMGTEGIE